jgi:hypothetical protein
VDALVANQDKANELYINQAPVEHYVAAGAAPVCEVDDAGFTHVYYTSTQHPSFKCTHAGTVCTCTLKHPTHDTGGCKQVESKTNGKLIDGGGDCTETGKDPVTTFSGWTWGSSEINDTNFDIKNINYCKSTFGDNSRPANIDDYVDGIAGITAENSWVCVAKGAGGELATISPADGSASFTGWKDAKGRFVSLKNYGHIRMGIRPNTDVTSMSQPVYSTQPMTVYYGAWGEGYDLGSSGFTWGNISRQLAPCKIACVHMA